MMHSTKLRRNLRYADSQCSLKYIRIFLVNLILIPLHAHIKINFCVLGFSQIYFPLLDFWHLLRKFRVLYASNTDQGCPRNNSVRC